MLASKRNTPKTVDANLYNHSKTHRIERHDAFINSLITACNKIVPVRMHFGFNKGASAS